MTDDTQIASEIEKMAIESDSFPDRTDEIIARFSAVRTLPTLPVVVHRVRQAIRNPRVDAKRLARIIEDDPAMMARVLRVVNSVLYGGVEPISSLQLAVARLGLNAVSNIAISTSVFSAYAGAGQKDFDRKEFWRHCITCGIGSAIINAKMEPIPTERYRADLLHLCGVLHDIGKILLEQYMHEEFMLAIRLAHSAPMPLIEAERRIVGSDHARLGAWLGSKWNLPREIQQVIRWHHDPDQADSDCRELAGICRLSNCLCNMNKLGHSGDDAVQGCDDGMLSAVQLPVEALPEIVAEIQARTAESEVFMSLV